MAVAVETRTIDYVDAIAHLPAGGTLIFQRVPWEEYEELLQDLGARYRARVSYDHGKLEISMPLPIHESYKEFFVRLMHVLTDELEIDLECLGSTTYKYENWLAGVEPDTCFYVQSAARVIGIERFDLSAPPPPPDIVVEIDISAESIGRFHIYQKLGVPEIWRCEEEQMQIYHLRETGYVETSTSHAFPFLSSERIFQTLDQSKTQGQSATLRVFRQWVRSARPQ